MNIPSYRKSKPVKPARVKIEEVTHDRDTKKAREAKEFREEKSALRKEEEVKSQEMEKYKIIMIENELPSLLKSLKPNGFIVRANPLEDITKREDYITLDGECMKILNNKPRKLNYTLVLATLRYPYTIIIFSFL